MMIAQDNDLYDHLFSGAWRKAGLAYLGLNQDLDQMTFLLGVDMFRSTDSPTLVCR